MPEPPPPLGNLLRGASPGGHYLLSLTTACGPCRRPMTFTTEELLVHMKGLQALRHFKCILQSYGGVVQHKHKQLHS